MTGNEVDLFMKAAELWENDKFEPALTRLKEALSFHPEGAKAYEYMLEAKQEPNLEFKMRHLERAKEAYLYILETLANHPERERLKPIEDMVKGHQEVMRKTRAWCLEEFDKGELWVKTEDFVPGTVSLF